MVSSLERRRLSRVPIKLPLRYKLDDVWHEGHSGNLGLGGMFILSEEGPAYGTKVEIEVELPGSSEVSSLPAVVRWVSTGGFGAQFLMLGARTTRALVTALDQRVA